MFLGFRDDYIKAASQKAKIYLQLIKLEKDHVKRTYHYTIAN